MKDFESRKFSVQLGFEEVSLPPFEDILIIGRKCPQGKIGLSKSFELLVPNEFELFEIDDPVVEAIFVNKRILKKLDKKYIIPILEEKIFPFVSDSEILKVDFKLRVFYDNLEIDINENR
jgi:hypothetical protein